MRALCRAQLLPDLPAPLQHAVSVRLMNTAAAHANGRACLSGALRSRGGQVGSSEGERNSLLYNESCFLVVCRSALHVLRRTPAPFGPLARARTRVPGPWGTGHDTEDAFEFVGVDAQSCGAACAVRCS